MSSATTSSAASAVDRVLADIAQHETAAVNRLCDWLRIASISTDPKYAPQCRAAAQWAADRLTEAGLRAELCETGTPAAPGHPIVLAHSPGSPDYRGPHVLFYGHYDVQPVDPIELWESPPFEPVIKDAVANGPGRRVVARGAVDDKGQVMTFLEALRAYKAVTGQPAGGVKFTVLLEGEEESGSVHLDDFIRSRKADLQQCQVCLISDTGMLGRGKPAITYGVRGLAYTQITLHGPDQDLHSGLWGGRVLNPILALSRVLAQLHDEHNRVTIPGFYQGVPDLSPSERAAWQRLNLSAAESLRTIGLPPESDWGETGYSAVEREWARPTAEINGLWGGYTGAGAKTVIPSKASAKVSFRLVADQDPQKITQMFFAWLQARTPRGYRWELEDLHGGYPATLPIDSREIQAAARALKRASDVDCAMIKSGGSIPVAGTLKRELGMSTIFMGFGLDDDRVHSPNEKFELDCFRLGCRSHALFIDELLKMGK
jgi:acetylornithine deacetylase/succinyl-diaminopimelate desuccinylase-like protein